MTREEKIIWTENAKPREQIVMLRMLSAFGEKFTATHQEICETIGINQGNFPVVLHGLKELGWVKSKRVYEKGRNGPKHCEYKLKV